MAECSVIGCAIQTRRTCDYCGQPACHEHGYSVTYPHGKVWLHRVCRDAYTKAHSKPKVGDENNLLDLLK